MSLRRITPALLLGLATLQAGCAHDPSATFTIVTADSRQPDRAWPAEHVVELDRYSSQALARWSTCTRRMRRGGERRFTWERVPEARDPDLALLPARPTRAQGTVQGTRGILPLSYWLWLTPEARYSWVAHEMGHTWGILDLDTGLDRALMSKTASAPDVTARDCLELCRLGWC